MKDRRRLTRIAGAVLLLASFWSCGEGERNWRTITVTSPNGSETLVAGSTVAVTWSTIGEVGNVTIELSTDGGSSWTVLVPSTDNDGEEYVVLPYTPGTECLIRVGETDGDPSDASNAEFEIAAAPISLAWAKRAGGTDWDGGTGVAVLPDGSVFVIGHFDETVMFGSGEANETALTSTSSYRDAFLARYDPNGELVWARSDPAQSCGVSVLTDGSAFVTGYFAGTATFGQGETNETVLTCAGIFDVFLARYDSEGALVWARRAGGTGDQSAVGVAALSDGSAFITGAFRLMMILGPGEANETTLASEGYDAFLARYNPDGTLAWATSTSGTYCWSSDVAALSDGSVFMAGRSQAAVTFGEGEVNETAFPREGLFLARYNSDATLAWAKCFGNGCEEKAGVSAVLTDGSVLLTGWFQGTVTFGPGEANETALTATGGSDVFLARYNPDGTLGWARRDGGTGEDSGHGVAVLPDGSTFVAGSFWGSAIFGAGDANETILVSAVGNPDVFLARYDADGTLAWATRAGGASFDQGSRVAALSDGSTLVTGFFRGPATFGPGEVNETILTSSGNNDVFLARYDPDGALAWVVHGGGSNNDFPEGLALLSDGSAFVTGCFRETATFGPGEANETVLTSAGDKDVFLARYNPDGSLAWAAQAGGADRDEGLGLAVLPDGTAFVTGYFRGVATFGLGGANETVLDAGVYGDAFLACYNANGTLGWAVSTGHEGYATGYGVAVLADASALVTGRFGETVSFGHGDPNETALTSVGSDDIFLARYNADGTLDAVVRAGGTGSESGGNVAALPDGSALVTGSFRGVATFGPGELNETTLTGAGTPDIFVARYDP